MSRMHIRSIMHLYCYAIALRKCRALCSCYVLDSQFFSCIEHFLMTVDTEIQMIDLILCHIFSSQNPGAGPECPHCSRLHPSVASCAGAGLGDDGDRWARVGKHSTQPDLMFVWWWWLNTKYTRGQYTRCWPLLRFLSWRYYDFDIELTIKPIKDEAKLWFKWTL